MVNWFIKHYMVTIFTLCIIAIIVSVVILFPPIRDDSNTIYRQINAYIHLPNGNTEVYYDGGALSEVEGKWYFNQPTKYYEFYRNENSTIWNLRPY